MIESRRKMSDVRELYARLRGRLFLSSMMGYTNGEFCGRRGRGCAMVQLGAYLAEPPAYGAADLVLPPSLEDCVRFFASECKRIKDFLDTVICVNIATPKLEWGLDAAKCLSEAGGIFELNIHGGYKPYLNQGKIRAMVLPEHQNELFEWLEAFSKLERPIIVKFREGAIDDYTPILDKIKGLNLLGIHFNVRDDKTRRPNFDFVKMVKQNYDFFLLASGHVRSSKDARKLFGAGADMVGIAEPVIRDPSFIDKIAKKMAKGT
jgi:tRNA-dihydrouridine synthase